MSLITDNLLQKLWESAQTNPHDKSTSAKLWQHLWNKHLFPENEWVVSLESPPVGSGRDLVYIAIEYMGSEILEGPAVLAFHEAKAPSSSSQDLQEAENHAYDVCVKYLEDHPDFLHMYAFTTFGTEGRAWKCSRSRGHMDPLFGTKDLAEHSQYIEVHSPEAQSILKVVQVIKTV
ncbi:hypothetical protein N7456_005964 [Penicillium angulare]|uniref:Uncharacterized protein n=1 Tax=Penicillium angulare TaxID=116970 RepID=A0A9W9KJT9_9EURO|nr:hypothetical protein N7456_005964 [Penicillium angulare]